MEVLIFYLGVLISNQKHVDRFIKSRTARGPSLSQDSSVKVATSHRFAVDIGVIWTSQSHANTANKPQVIVPHEAPRIGISHVFKENNPQMHLFLFCNLGSLDTRPAQRRNISLAAEEQRRQIRLKCAFLDIITPRYRTLSYFSI